MAQSIKIQPLGTRILVQAEELEDKTPGGLVVPPSANDDKRPATGKVVKLGEGKDKDGKKISFEVKVGDNIYFKKYAPELITSNGEEYLLLEADDVLAIIK
jgi:chaperonin GroES